MSLRVWSCQARHKPRSHRKVVGGGHASEVAGLLGGYANEVTGMGINLAHKFNE